MTDYDMKQTTLKLAQISARVSEGTIWKLDRVSKMRGMRKAFVLEQALLYHFRVLEDFFRRESFKITSKVVLPYMKCRVIFLCK